MKRGIPVPIELLRNQAIVGSAGLRGRVDTQRALQEVERNAPWLQILENVVLDVFIHRRDNLKTRRKMSLCNIRRVLEGDLTAILSIDLETVVHLGIMRRSDHSARDRAKMLDAKGLEEQSQFGPVDDP